MMLVKVLKLLLMYTIVLLITGLMDPVGYVDVLILCIILPHVDRLLAYLIEEL